MVCQQCNYKRDDRFGLQSPPFFGPRPEGMDPCADCWAWKAELDAKAARRIARWSDEQLDAAVAKAVEAERNKTAAELLSVLAEVDKYYQTDWVTAVTERNDDFDWDAIRARGVPR